jgi:hypothetical protein
LTLLTNGCSFTWGAELDDRELRFGALLSRKLNCNLVDISENGSSNERILRTTFDYLNNSDVNLNELIVVIGWSGISRTEYFTGGWVKMTPTMIGTNEVATNYYSYMQSKQQDNLKFYNQVLLLQLWLEKHNVKYFMFRIDDGQTKMMIKDGSQREVVDGFDTEYLTESQVKSINLDNFPSYIDNDYTFREFALRNGGGLKPGRHPDEKSHELFTEHIYENLC